MWLRALSYMAMLTISQSIKAEESFQMETAPSLELLEYLGSMVEGDGELIGPHSLQDETPAADGPSDDESSSRDAWVGSPMPEVINRD
jgi:hypothetical protein